MKVNTGENNLWYIPQGVTYDNLLAVIRFCHNSQKKHHEITLEEIQKIIPQNSKTIRYTVNMLESIGILVKTGDKGVYEISDNSLKFTEKLIVGEKIEGEAKEIIEKSFLSKILEIISSKKDIDKNTFTNKILVNSTAGIGGNKTPYLTSIFAILDLLNACGEISSEDFVRLRSKPQNKNPKTAESKIHSSKIAKKTYTTSIEEGVLCVLKTETIELKIKSQSDFRIAKAIFDDLEKKLNDSNLGVEKTV